MVEVVYPYPRTLPYVCLPGGAVLWEDLDRLADEVADNIGLIFPGYTVEKATIYLDLGKKIYRVQGQSGLTVIGWETFNLPSYINIYSCEELERRFFPPRKKKKAKPPKKKWKPPIRRPRIQEKPTEQPSEQPTEETEATLFDVGVGPPKTEEEKKAIGILILLGLVALFFFARK